LVAVTIHQSAIFSNSFSIVRNRSNVSIFTFSALAIANKVLPEHSKISAFSYTISVKVVFDTPHSCESELTVIISPKVNIRMM